MGMERALYELTMKFFWPRPALSSSSQLWYLVRNSVTYLGRPQDQDRPSWLEDRLSRASCHLDFLDLINSPDHREVQIRVDIIDVLHKSDLIPISAKESYKLLVIHTSKDSTLADLEAIYMQDRQDCT